MWRTQGQNMWSRMTGMIREANYPPQSEGRIVRDLGEAYSRYPSLNPRVDTYTTEEGATQKLVVLEGTIPIAYRGSPFNIPVEVWIMPYYPSGPPKIYVKPTRNMVLFERHPHVDRNGLVYLPYLSNWTAQQSNILGSVLATAQEFSQRPPVYERRKNPLPHEQERQRLVSDLVYRARTRLQKVSEDGTLDIAQLLERREKALAESGSVPKEVQEMMEKRKKLEKTIALLLAEQEELDNFIDTNHVRDGDREVDTMIHPKDVLSEQILECISEDYALSDALDELVEAISHQIIEVDVFLKETRRIAREQFFARALLRKVKLHQAAEQQHQQHQQHQQQHHQ